MLEPGTGRRRYQRISVYVSYMKNKTWINWPQKNTEGAGQGCVSVCEEEGVGMVWLGVVFLLVVSKIGSFESLGARH